MDFLNLKCIFPSPLRGSSEIKLLSHNNDEKYFRGRCMLEQLDSIHQNNMNISSNELNTSHTSTSDNQSFDMILNSISKLPFLEEDSLKIVSLSSINISLLYFMYKYCILFRQCILSYPNYITQQTLSLKDMIYH